MGLKWFVGLSSGNEAGASVPSDTHLIFKLEQKLSRLLRSVGRLKTTLQAAISRLLMCASSIFGALCSNNATEVGQFSEAMHTASSDQSSCVSQKKVDVDKPVRPLCITF